MANTRLDWTDELERWLTPFVARLGHKARRRMCLLYLAGRIGLGDRMSAQPMAELLAPGEYDQLPSRLSCPRDRPRFWGAIRLSRP
jgi:hypothetical protein